MYWTIGNGTIELDIPKKIASLCSHSGSCDNDINKAMKMPIIKKQLDKINPNDLASELKEYGAWDEIELSNHEENKARILWIACGDILDGKF